ncbi:MAG: 23S rRNA (uracil(1939)-C(5))-methyltransferase RlmD [Candidatus Omnitrophica bacterium]|nr:23S rRNA (uracil(1939)-C(5))-methyltransferase RlmD [Candidatus Omnitrophota bacterium]
MAYPLTIEKIVYPGRSLGRREGKVVFTDEGAPGETVLIEPLKDKKTYIEARTLEILTPSPRRIPPRCTHYKICAPYQYLDYPFQLEIKKAQLSDTYIRTLKTAPLDIPLTPAVSLWGYRNKVNFSLIPDNGTSQWGYHDPHRPEHLLPVTDCHLISPTMNRCKDRILALLDKEQKEGIEEITLRENAKSQLLILLSMKKPSVDIRSIAPLIAKEFSLSGISCEYKGRISVVYGQDYFDEQCGNVIYRVGVHSFFQINRDALTSMFDTISGWLALSGKETLVDLYSGIGTFGLFFAQKASRIIAVEPELSNVFCLEENIRRNRIDNVSVFHYTSEQWFSLGDTAAIDTLIVDPPRRGLGPYVCEHILKKRPKRIVYVSCDMSTFIRDIKSLIGSYGLKRLAAFDFFPHTPHLELCGLLELK